MALFASNCKSEIWRQQLKRGGDGLVPGLCSGAS